MTAVVCGGRERLTVVSPGYSKRIREGYRTSFVLRLLHVSGRNLEQWELIWTWIVVECNPRYDGGGSVDC